MDNVFAVIVTYNGEACVDKCLESLQQRGFPIEVVVVDNDSRDDTVQQIRQVMPGAKLLCLRKNLGFGRANNIGIKYAYEQGAHHVLLINQDAWVEGDAAEGLADLQQQYPEFGILSPLHLAGSGEKLDSLFAQHLSKTPEIGSFLSDLMLDHPRRTIYPVGFVNAAIWMLSRHCLERVGLFNPAFTHYGEDLEYADRLRHLGIKMGVVPGLRAIHDRPQFEEQQPVDLSRHLLKATAVIRYRLSRQSQPAFRNLLSAASRVLLAQSPIRNGLFSRVKLRFNLAWILATELPDIMRKKRIASKGGHCFFSDAEADEQTYKLAPDRA